MFHNHTQMSDERNRNFVTLKQQDNEKFAYSSVLKVDKQSSTNEASFYAINDFVFAFFFTRD